MHADVSEALKQDGIAVSVVAAGRYKTELSSYGPLSSEARAAVQNTVDSHYDAFVRAVARGRGVPQKAIRDGMGQGRMLLSDAARAANMIDGTATLAQVVTKMQARVAGRDRSAAGMRAFVDAEARKPGSATISSSASASTRAAMERETDILRLT
jgi:ClpP class serine protease